MFIPIELIDGVVAPSAPLGVQLQNGWTSYGSGYADPGYIVSAEHQVELMGMVAGGTTAPQHGAVLAFQLELARLRNRCSP